MNRADLIRAVAACEAAAKEFRAALAADAAAEWESQGTAPTWRLGDVTVSCSLAHPSIHIFDEPKFLEWVRQFHPDQVETLVRVRPAWQAVFFESVLERGDPPCDEGGEAIPGVQYMVGGSFKSLSIRPSTELQGQLRRAAREMVAGVRPLALPGAEES